MRKLLAALCEWVLKSDDPRKEAYRMHRKVYPKATGDECDAAYQRSKALGLTMEEWIERAAKYKRS